MCGAPPFVGGWSRRTQLPGGKRQRGEVRGLLGACDSYLGLDRNVPSLGQFLLASCLGHLAAVLRERIPDCAEEILATVAVEFQLAFPRIFTIDANGHQYGGRPTAVCPTQEDQ